MKKTILIPTDFTIESLVQVKQAVLQNQNNRLKIILVYSCFLTDSISDLLYYSPEKIIRENTSDQFNQALSILINKFPEQISEINIEVFHGFSISYLEKFINKHNIDHTYIPKNYKLKETDNSFDIVPFILKSKTECTELQWGEEIHRFQNDTLANLFLD
jgi:hypothetical protein